VTPPAVDTQVDLVPLVLLALELGEDMDHLGWRLRDDGLVDAVGFRCVGVEVARREIAAKRYADERARLSRERSAAAVFASGQQADRERAAVLAAIDARQRRFGGDDALATVYTAALDDRAAEQEPVLAELGGRVTTRVAADGFTRVDEHGDPIGGTS
jgi:hypothetical protein